MVKPPSNPIIATTTRSSISVKAFFRALNCMGNFIEETLRQAKKKAGFVMKM
jgi:hypothetical protein